MRALRGIGPALLGLMFIVGWALVFLLLWSLDAHPRTGAFGGFGSEADVGDMIYLAVSAAVGSTPPDVTARSNLAQTLLAAEFASGALLLGAYATALMRSERESEGTRTSLAAATHTINV